jgi:hypothetical protein
MWTLSQSVHGHLDRHLKGFPSEIVWQGPRTLPGRMPASKTLSEIVSGGLRFEVDEALAVIQQLIASSEPHPELETPVGSPSLDNVSIDSDGSVSCPACAAPLAVPDMGRLLQAMLPHYGTVHVPGALRYAMARALLEVEAPPFDSIAAFANALKRLETGERSAVLRRLCARSALFQPPTGARAEAGSQERRRSAPSVRELRTQLREADQERYLLVMARAADDVEHVARRSIPDSTDDIAECVLERAIDHRRQGDARDRLERASVATSRAVIAGAAAVGLSFGIGYVGVRQLSHYDGVSRPPLETDRTTSGPGSAAPPSDGRLAAEDGRHSGVADDAQRRRSSSDQLDDISLESSEEGARRQGDTPTDGARPPRVKHLSPGKSR